MKYIEHDYEEFYDLKNDPDEKQNFAKKAEYSKNLIVFREKYLKLKIYTL